MLLHTLSEFTDTQLMLLARRGRRDALEVLYDRHRDRVFRVAIRIVGHREDALEVVQDVFVRVIGASDRYQPTAKVTTWLHRITVNCSLRLCERRPRNVVVLPAQMNTAADTPGPLARAEARQLAQQLQLGLLSLDPRHRAAFALCVLEGCTIAEASEALEIPRATVKTHVHRARQTLRRRIEREQAP